MNILIILTLCMMCIVMSTKFKTKSKKYLLAESLLRDYSDFNLKANNYNSKKNLFN